MHAHRHKHANTRKNANAKKAKQSFFRRSVWLTSPVTMQDTCSSPRNTLRNIMGKKSSGGVGLTKSISLGSLQNIGEQQQQHQTQQQSAMPPSNMKKSISLAYLLSRGDSKASATSPSSGGSSTTSPNSDVVPAVSEL